MFTAFAALLAVPLPAPLEVAVFESVGCGECARVEAEVLAPLEAELAGAIRIQCSSVEDARAYETLIRWEARHHVSGESAAPRST